MSDAIKEIETSKSALERHLQACSAAYEVALQSGDQRTMEKILTIAMSVCAIWNRQAAREEHESNLIMREKLKAHVANVQSTYNSVTSLVFRCISGGLSIVGGLFTAAPIAGRTIFSINTNTIGKLGSGASAIGQGTGSFAGIADASSESSRAGYNHTLEESKNQRDSHNQNSQQSDSRTRDTLSSMKDHHNSERQARREMLG